MTYQPRFQPRNDIRGLFGTKPPTQAELFAREREVYGKDYSTEERRKLAKEGKALPDLSYPMATADDLEKALVLIKSGHGDTAAATELFRKRASALGRSDLIDKLEGKKKEGEK
jgi:hypothetical protein